MDLIYEGITTAAGGVTLGMAVVRMDLIYEGITTVVLNPASELPDRQNGPDLRRDYDLGGIIPSQDPFHVRMDLIYEGITTSSASFSTRLSKGQNGPDLRRDYDTYRVATVWIP